MGMADKAGLIYLLLSIAFLTGYAVRAFRFGFKSWELFANLWLISTAGIFYFYFARKDLWFVPLIWIEGVCALMAHFLKEDFDIRKIPLGISGCFVLMYILLYYREGQKSFANISLMLCLIFAAAAGLTYALLKPKTPIREARPVPLNRRDLNPKPGGKQLRKRRTE